MKKITSFVLMAGLAAILFSCEKNPAPEAVTLDSVEKVAYGNVKITFDVPEQATKTLSTQTRETKINSIHVFIFNKTTGKRETDLFETVSSDVSGSYSMTLTSLTGDKIVWAVVNAPRLNNVPDENTLKLKVSDLGENTPTSLLMSGFDDKVTVKETNANDPSKKDVVTETTIKVFHLGARISLNSIKVDFRNTDLEGATFTVKSLYLKNVAGKINIDGTTTGLNLGESASWYNLANENAVNGASDAIKKLTSDLSLNLGCNVRGETTSMGYSWYVYPNDTDSDHDNTSNQTSLPRCTRLVIKGQLSGTSVGGTLNKASYYVFTLPKIERNHAYNIESLKITMEGKANDDDDTLTTSGQLKATITVEDWDKKETLTYEL